MSILSSVTQKLLYERLFKERAVVAIILTGSVVTGYTLVESLRLWVSHVGLFRTPPSLVGFALLLWGISEIISGDNKLITAIIRIVVVVLFVASLFLALATIVFAMSI